MAVGEGLVDDRHPRRRGRVTLLDQPPAQQLDAERVDKLGVDLVEVGPRLLAGVGSGPADDREGMLPDLDRDSAGDARARDSRDGAHALEHAVVEGLHLGRHPVHVRGGLLEVPGPAQQDVGAHQVARCRSRGGCPAPAGRRASSGRRRPAAPSTSRLRPPAARNGRGDVRRSRRGRPPSTPRRDPPARRVARAPGRRPGSSRPTPRARSRGRARPPGCRAADRGSSLGTMSAKSRVPQKARIRPKPQPTRDRSMFSVRSWPIRRPRPAPVAARSASSFWRAVPAASRRLATFAHAISSTKLTAPSRKVSTSRGRPK